METEMRDVKDGWRAREKKCRGRREREGRGI
jgi:hypothetical protein